MTRLALDLKIYGPRYAQFQIVCLEEAWVNAQITLTLAPVEREPEESPETVKGLGASFVRSFKRGYVRAGEEILCVPPVGADGSPAGMDMDELLASYVSCEVTVCPEHGEAVSAQIPNLADYWGALSAAGIVDAPDPAVALRTAVADSTRRFERTMDKMMDALTDTAAQLIRSRMKPVRAITYTSPRWWQFRKRRELKKMRDQLSGPVEVTKNERRAA